MQRLSAADLLSFTREGLDEGRVRRILEPGCGTGLYTRMLLDAFPGASIDGHRHLRGDGPAGARADPRSAGALRDGRRRGGRFREIRPGHVERDVPVVPFVRPHHPKDGLPAFGRGAPHVHLLRPRDVRGARRGAPGGAGGRGGGADGGLGIPLHGGDRAVPFRRLLPRGGRGAGIPQGIPGSRRAAQEHKIHGYGGKRAPGGLEPGPARARGTGVPGAVRRDPRIVPGVPVPRRRPEGGSCDERGLHHRDRHQRRKDDDLRPAGRLPADERRERRHPEMGPDGDRRVAFRPGDAPAAHGAARGRSRGRGRRSLPVPVRLSLVAAPRGGAGRAEHRCRGDRGGVPAARGGPRHRPGRGGGRDPGPLGERAADLRSRRPPGAFRPRGGGEPPRRHQPRAAHRRGDPPAEDPPHGADLQPGPRGRQLVAGGAAGRQHPDRRGDHGRARARGGAVPCQPHRGRGGVLPGGEGVPRTVEGRPDALLAPVHPDEPPGDRPAAADRAGGGAVPVRRGGQPVLRRHLELVVRRPRPRPPADPRSRREADGAAGPRHVRRHHPRARRAARANGSWRSPRKG